MDLEDRIESGSGFGRSGVVITFAVVTLALGFGLIFSSFLSNYRWESSGAVSIEEIASVVGSAGDDLPGDTLVEGIPQQDGGFEVLYNDPRTGDLKTTRSIAAEIGADYEISGTVENYSISGSDGNVKFTYNSTTEETTEEELN